MEVLPPAVGFNSPPPEATPKVSVCALASRVRG